MNLKRLAEQLSDCHPAIAALMLIGYCVVSSGCSSESPPPLVKMKCVAVHYASHGNSFAIVQDEHGERFHAWWSGHLPVEGDTWMVQGDRLIERVKEPE